MKLLDLEDPRERLLGRCLRRQAELQPDADFIVWDEQHYSYGQVNELANASARGFREAGVRAGDSVSFLMASCPEWIGLTFGLAKLGAIWVPTNTDYKGRWLAESFADGGARVLVTDAELLPKIAQIGGHPFERIFVRGEVSDDPGLGVPLHPIEQLVSKPDGEPYDAGQNYGDTTAVLWTSGTTGRAKGVEQSHNAWIRAALSGARNSGVREGDVIYNCLPMYQSAAWVANIYRALVCGLPCGMDPAFSASHFWDRTRHYGATMVFTLGAMHMFLLNAPKRDDDADNPVRVAGFVPTPDHLVPVFKQRFGLEEIFQGYGQSEVLGMINRTPGTTYPPNALGDLAEGIEVELLDDDDRAVGIDEPGEFCVRPTEPFTIFNGYWRNPEATLRAWRNLWYHTGDLGRRDAEGHYYFVDRKADFIRYKGRNISSFAVEATLSAHPAVQLCGVHGIPSEELDSEAEIKACVVLKPGESATPEQLARFVNDTAPYFFVPRYIEIMDALPQTPTGRVQKFKLRERGLTASTWDGRAEGFEVKR